MCYRASIQISAADLASRFNAKFVDPEKYRPHYHVSAFGFPALPVITNSEPALVQRFHWGLIPHWAGDRQTAERIRVGTFNAKSETAFEKPSFRSAMLTKRCLVPATGFFEFHGFKSKSYPFYITLLDEEIFSFAGIWDMWTDRVTGETLSTFSILTVAANPLMEKIHNTKKRMPVILPRAAEGRWLSQGLAKEDISALCAPFDEKRMKAHAVNRLITSRTENADAPDALKEYVYPELGGLQDFQIPGRF